MADWSQSHFLQSLGWATLNSFWQMALLWCLYLATTSVFKLNSNQKYRFSVLAVLIGFGWFLASFVFYFNTDTTTSLAFINNTVSHSNSFLKVVLTSASIAYLALLMIPSYRLFKNWQFVKAIRTIGIHKADLNYRLFVQKIAVQIGIQKKVLLYVSDIVKSPVTVGYLKPVILLPVAALNNLSVAQVEAVLLHELSHIRRYDYLVNLVVSCIHALMYFNPFVKSFIRNIERERENCCDELVLQFGYDKVGYASALLTLEKVATQHQVLAMAATGKNYLLSRIEKIVGMEKKNKGMRLNHFAGFLAALFCILIFNSILIIKEEKSRSLFAYENFSNPFSLFSPENDAPVNGTTPLPVNADQNFWAETQTKEKEAIAFTMIAPSYQPSEESEYNEVVPEVTEGFLRVAQDDIDAALTIDEKEDVRTTVANTKRMLKSQWPMVAETIGDDMTAEEKTVARQQYLTEVERINWTNLEKNIKANYKEVDLLKLKATVSEALAVAELDSIQKSYGIVLSHLSQARKDIEASKAKVNCSPIPDCSVDDIKKAEAQVRKQIDSLNTLKTRKVIKL